MNDFESTRAMDTFAFVGSHSPRQCGIAAFTADLSSAVQQASPISHCMVVAVNDLDRRYVYPEQVRYQISEESLVSYRRAADFLNVSDVAMVSLQHEYGIFGGVAGSHVLTLLRDLRIPTVTTLHTILAEPNASQRAAMGEICALSARIVVMSRRGKELLCRVHDVASDKIDIIPHGIPALPGHAPSKAKLGLQGRRVILTFGLLSPDKGIEYVIDALPAIAARHPDVLYIALGATHPHVKEREGEAYRLMLEARGARLGLEHHLVFNDRFVSQRELVQFLAAADVYITPYLNLEQATSGTLAYAVGSGKAVISTPYRYAEELLSEGRGVLVPARSSEAIAREALQLLGNETLKSRLERRAMTLGQKMQWPEVAGAYLGSFRQASKGYRQRSVLRPVSTVAPNPLALPEVKLGHVRVLTDGTGMLQHATYCVPRQEDGYCLDDNARALRLIALAEVARIESPLQLRALTMQYLAFVRHAFDAELGRFRNFMSYSRRWIETCGSEDSHGRAVWALGTVRMRSTLPGVQTLAAELFESALPAANAFTSPRAWSYTLLGIAECVHSPAVSESSRSTGLALASRLLELFRRASREDWLWFEDGLTYCNARLPEALMASGTWMGHAEMVDVGLTALTWLVEIQSTKAGVFAPIGSPDFFVRGGARAFFDQQPVEACGTVSACLLAHRITGEKVWLERASRAFKWFLGGNQLEQWLYDPATGGCRDGLHEDRANENQGAESTLSFLMALLDMRQTDHRIEVRPAKPTVIAAAALVDAAG